MIRPAVTAGIKEPNSFSRARVDRSNVTPLVPIADHTGIRQVVRGGGTAVLATDDVVDLVREAGLLFMDEAVFATVVRAPRYVGSEFLADITGHERGFGGPAPLPFLECVLTP